MTQLMEMRPSAWRPGRMIAIGGLVLATQLSIAGLMVSSDAWADAERGDARAFAGAAPDHLMAGFDRPSHQSKRGEISDTESVGGSTPATSVGPATSPGPATSTGGGASVSSSAGSTASATASVGSGASLRESSRSFSRTIDRGNVTISISVSRSVAIVNESTGMVIGRAVDRSVAIATDTSGQATVTVRSMSRATIRSVGTVSGVSMNVAANGSAEAAIAGGPSASATSSAEASIGP